MAVDTGRVDTGKVTRRRRVHYANNDELVADAERLLAGGYERLGNWSLGQIAMHLSNAMRMALDGPSMMAAWPVRMIARVFFKNAALRGPMKPGFKLPKKAAVLLPDGKISDDEGVAALRDVVARYEREPLVHPHPFFGKLTPEEWRTLMLRHAEMHMSFLLPK